jgi:hypothetical protein
MFIMIYQLFPRSNGLTADLQNVVAAFEQADARISSKHNNLNSNAVLAVLEKPLSELGYLVETGKGKNDKIPVPVLFGTNNQIDKEFNADAYNKTAKIVIEIEAGRATENNQFLKDIFQACMMHEVEWLVIAVREQYRTHKDFEIIFTFLETMYISNRLRLPLHGILLIGY